MTNDVQGIYQIKNLKNNKIYIGSSKHIYKRWQIHRRELKRGKHVNQHLQGAWNKYGEEVFKFSIVERIEDISLLLTRESYWIVEHESINQEKGYNIDIPNKNGKRIELYKKEINNGKRLCRPIIQIDIETGEIIKRFQTRLEVQAQLGLSERQVGMYVENNIFKARSDKAKILHPYQNTIIMYEEFYRPDYDYKAAIKPGELIKVWKLGTSREGDTYLGQLTHHEINHLQNINNINDYRWVKLRKHSYENGSVTYKDLKLEFIKKEVVDNPRCILKIEVPKSQQSSGESLPKIIIGLKDNNTVESYSNLKEMSIQLGITYKMATRLISNEPKKRKRRGIVYVYEKDYLCTEISN